MNYGRFFALDLDASDISHGIAVFNYHEVQNLNRNNWCKEIHDTPQYPIYLQFTPEGVSFYLHYVKELGENQVAHQDSLILSLSLSSDLDVKDNLTEAINRIYDTVFPLNLSNNPIYEVIQESVSKPTGLVCYSSLNIFNKGEKRSCGKGTDKKEPFNHHFVRKLFLDFLYDLEHSDVFENTALYDDIYIKLHKNFLFNAIANKAEYYYQRYQQVLYNGTLRAPWNIPQKKLFYAEYYAKAEQRWVETITNAKADRCFNDSQWFSDVESEMDSVYISKSEVTCRDCGKVENDYMECCNEYVSKIIVPPHNVLSNKYKSTKDEITGIVTTSAKAASNWYLKRYSFSGTLKIWYGRWYKWMNVITVSFVLSLCSIFLLPSFDKKIFSDQVTPSLIIVSGILFLWVLGFINHRRWHIRSVSCINILMPRLFASIVAAWFTLAIGEDIFKGFFDIIHQKWVSCTLLVILVVFVNYEIGKINPYISFCKKVYRTTILVSVAFSYAFIVGILVINFFGGKYLERSDYIDEFYINNVFTKVPDFKIPENRQPRIVNDIFYETLNKYNDSIVRVIGRTWKNIAGVDTLHTQTEKNRYPMFDVMDNTSDTIYKIDYRFTLVLLKEFVHNSHVPDMAKMQEKLFDGSTTKSRVDSVCVLYDKLRVQGCQSCQMDSSFYSSACCELLRCLDNHHVYQQVLKELAPMDKDRHEILKEDKFNILIFRDMLLQFTFFAMFIGIFIQLIVEEKSITEPV